jgi:hypothetical protein
MELRKSRGKVEDTKKDEENINHEGHQGHEGREMGVGLLASSFVLFVFFVVINLRVRGYKSLFVVVGQV